MVRAASLCSLHALVVAGAALAQPSSTAPNLTPPVTPVPAPPPAPELMGVIDKLRQEAGGLLPTVATRDARRFLVATSFLPIPGDRTVYVNRAARTALSEGEYDALPEADRAVFAKRPFTEHDYYYTRYGSPLAYARAIDLVSRQTPGGEGAFRGKKVLDFGFGTIGHLRLLASLGAEVVGVEVDPVLKAAYSAPFDTGVIKGAPFFEDEQPDGSLRLVFGRFPADPAVAASVGEGYDLILSKNTLKNGYINPKHTVDPRLLIDLGMPPAEFLASLASRLNPGGLLMIYNICPSEESDPAKWVPWSDGRSPFGPEHFQACGLELIALDADDTDAVRAMAKPLGWTEGDQAMDIENDLVVHYTLAKKPGATRQPAQP